MNVYICSAARTPIGSYGGSLKDTTAPQLATVAAKAAIERSGIDLQTQILDQMEFTPAIAYQEDGTIKLMDARSFRDELMGLADE